MGSMGPTCSHSACSSGNIFMPNCNRPDLGITTNDSDHEAYNTGTDPLFATNP